MRVFHLQSQIIPSGRVTLVPDIDPPQLFGCKESSDGILLAHRLINVRAPVIR